MKKTKILGDERGFAAAPKMVLRRCTKFLLYGVRDSLQRHTHTKQKTDVLGAEGPHEP